MRRRQGGKEKIWTECIQSGVRAFGLAGDRKTTASEDEVWVKTVTEGSRTFVAAWGTEEVDVVRQRQEKKETTRL